MSDYPDLQQIVGTVGRDPETRTTARGDNILKFSVAVTRQYGQGSDGKTEWVDVAVFNEDLQERVKAEVYKGAKVAIEGNLKQRDVSGKTYTDMIALRVGLVAWIIKGKATKKADDELGF